MGVLLHITVLYTHVFILQKWYSMQLLLFCNYMYMYYNIKASTALNYYIILKKKRKDLIPKSQCLSK